MAKKTKQEKELRRKRKKEQDKGKKGSGPLRMLNEQAEFHGCWINQNWSTAGMAYIVVARKMASGLLMFATFLLDTVKSEVRSCHASINVTPEGLQRSVLQQREGVEFLNADLDLVKKLLADTVQGSQKNGKTLPEDFHPCLKIVGRLERHLPSEIREMEGEPTRCIVYRIDDPELVETELCQMEFMEERDDSTPECKRFSWKKTGQKRPCSVQDGETLAELILEDGLLTLEIREERDAEHLHETLIRYLGTIVTRQD